MKKTKSIKRKNTKKYNIKTKMKLRKLRKTLQVGGMEKDYNYKKPESKVREMKIPEPKPSELKQLSKKQILQLLMKYLREKKKMKGE